MRLSSSRQSVVRSSKALFSTTVRPARRRYSVGWLVSLAPCSQSIVGGQSIATGLCRDRNSSIGGMSGAPARLHWFLLRSNIILSNCNKPPSSLLPEGPLSAASAFGNIGNINSGSSAATAGSEVGRTRIERRRVNVFVIQWLDSDLQLLHYSASKMNNPARYLDVPCSTSCALRQRLRSTAAAAAATTYCNLSTLKVVDYIQRRDDSERGKPVDWFVSAEK